LVATSNVESRLMWYSPCPPETLVILTHREYSEFTVRTLVNCNVVIPMTIDILVEKRKSGKLQMKTEMPLAIVERLRQGVLASPMVEGASKLVIAGLC